MHGLGSCHGTHPLHQLVDKLFYSHFFCLYQHLPVVQIGKHIVDDYTRRSQKPVTEYYVVPGLPKSKLHLHKRLRAFTSISEHSIIQINALVRQASPAFLWKKPIETSQLNIGKQYEL